MRYYGPLNGVLSQTAENTPPLPGGVFFTDFDQLANITGKCFFDAPPGAFAPVEASEYPAHPNHLFPHGGAGDIPKFMYEEVWFPPYRSLGYVGVTYNPLFEAVDIDSLSKTMAVTIDFDPIVGGGTHSVRPRMQIGRGTASAPQGSAPNSVCLLAANYGQTDASAIPSLAFPMVPGAIITEVIDISATRPAGAPQVIVDWRIGQFISTDEVVDYVPGSVVNDPAMRYFLDGENSSGSMEIGFMSGAFFYDWVFMVGLFDEFGGFRGWLTRNVPLPCGCGGATLTRFRLGFFNFWHAAIYLLSYAVIF